MSDVFYYSNKNLERYCVFTDPVTNRQKMTRQIYNPGVGKWMIAEDMRPGFSESPAPAEKRQHSDAKNQTWLVFLVIGASVWFGSFVANFVRALW